MNKTFEENYALLSSRFAISSFFLAHDKNILVSKSIYKKIQSQVEHWHSNLRLINEIDVLYVYGILLGLPYQALKKWLKEKNERRLVFIEKDPKQIFMFLHDEKASELLQDEQTHIYHLRSEELFLYDIALNFFSEKILVTSPLKVQTKKFVKLQAEIIKRSSFASYYCQDRIRSSLLFKNFVKNIEHLQNSFFVNKLKDKFKNIPAIVCGAGPSLNNSINDLFKLEDKALIIAGGSAIAALSQKGIIPHLGVVIDPNEEEFLRLSKSWAFEMPMIYSTRVCPRVFQTFNGCYGYFRGEIGGKSETWLDQKLNLKEDLLDKDLLDRGISVTSVCIAIAAYLGCSPIILNGVDLAFRDKKQYADGVVDPKDNILDKANLIAIKDKNNQNTFTSVPWILEAENISLWTKKTKYNLIDASCFGLEFKKMAKMTLKDIFIKHKTKPFDIRAYLHSLIQNAFFKDFPSQEKLLQPLQKSFLKCQEIVSQIIFETQKDATSSKLIVLQLELEEEEAYHYFLYDYLYIANNLIARQKLKTTKWHSLQKIIIEFLQEF